MTTAEPLARPDPWVFWAPASDAHIEAALDLAHVGPGDRFVDLGCGDGRVLVAAAQRGACVHGIDIDPALADRARARLAGAGLPGTVDVADMYSAPLAADVVYAYLTPAMLARLGPALLHCGPGARVVTPRYPVAGWEAEETGGGCFLYRLPARPEPPPVAAGWRWRGLVAVLPADRRCLVPLSVVAARGDVFIELDGPLSRAARAAPGLERVSALARVPVDVIFRGHGAGSVIAGSMRAQGEEMTLAAVFAREGYGEWGFAAEEGAAFRATLEGKIAKARNGHGGGGAQ